MDIIILFMIFACGCIKNKAVYIITLILGAIESVGGTFLGLAGFECIAPILVGLLGIIVPIVLLSQDN